MLLGDSRVVLSMQGWVGLETLTAARTHGPICCHERFAQILVAFKVYGSILSLQTAPGNVDVGQIRCVQLWSSQYEAPEHTSIAQEPHVQLLAAFLSGVVRWANAKLYASDPARPPGVP